MQLMGRHLGGEVEFSARREYGAGLLHIDGRTRLFNGLGEQMDIWSSHGDKLTSLPEGFHAIAHTENSAFAAMHATRPHSRRNSTQSHTRRIPPLPRSKTPNASSSRCNFTRRSRTRRGGKRSLRIFSSVSASARWIGRWDPSSTNPASAS